MMEGLNTAAAVVSFATQACMIFGGDPYLAKLDLYCLQNVD